MRPTFRTPSWRVAAIALGVGVTIAVSTLASTASGPTSVALAVWGGPSYAADVAGFHPLSAQLLADVPKAPKPAPSFSTRPGAPTTVITPELLPVPSNSPITPPDPTPPPVFVTPPPSPSPSPLPASLSIRLVADTSRTHPNGTIVYSFEVTNSGPGGATGVVVLSHVPDGTTLTGWTCGGAIVKANGADRISCGTSAGPQHPVAFGVASLAGGQRFSQRFWVTVNKDVRRHTDLAQHAHVFADGVDRIDSETITVAVP